MTAESETERVGIRTYVPRYQKERWQAEANDLDMSQAEYVRTMVQAGRRSFDLGASEGSGGDMPDEVASGDATPGVNGLEDRILDILEPADHHSWDELVAGLTDDIEDRLEDALGGLQQRNRIQYSGRHGGYTVVDDGE